MALCYICKEREATSNYRCRPCNTLYIQEWRKRNPDKVKRLANLSNKKNWDDPKQRNRLLSYNIVAKAIRLKKIVRPTFCEGCGLESKVQAHHHLGYEVKNRLKVKWLCRNCHNQFHQ